MGIEGGELGFFGAHFGLDGGVKGERGVDPMGDVVGVVAEGLGAAEDAGEGVVVFGGDGVEFVVVAAGAADGEAHEGAADGFELFVDDVHAEEAFVLLFVVGGAEGEEGGGGELAAALGGVGGGEEVAGDVFGDELVEGGVGVEGFDDVVAEAPGVFEGEGAAAAGAFGEAGDVEPVLGPAFGEGGGGQKIVNDLLE